MCIRDSLHGRILAGTFFFAYTGQFSPTLRTDFCNLLANAVKYDEISIEEVVAKKLAAMDLTASIMCMEQKMPMLVFAPVSYTHLDVYKRQRRSSRNILG